MYICPKCHNEISKTARICPYCNFKLKISLGRYQIREQELHEDVKNRKVIYNKQVIETKFKKVSKIEEYISRNIFKKALVNSTISPKQAEV